MCVYKHTSKHTHTHTQLCVFVCVWVNKTVAECVCYLTALRTEFSSKKPCCLNSNLWNLKKHLLKCINKEGNCVGKKCSLFNQWTHWYCKICKQDDFEV